MNTQEKIDYYIENKLNPEEKKRFEEELANDEALANEVKKRKFIHAKLTELLAYKSLHVKKDENFDLSETQNIQIEEDIYNFHENYTDLNAPDELMLKNILEGSNAGDFKHHEKSSYLWFKLAAGIAFIVLLSISLYYFENFRSSRNVKLTSQKVFEIFPYDGDVFLKDLMQSVTLFRHGIETELIDSDNQLIENSEKSKQILMLSDAITNLEGSNLPDARKRLEQLIHSEFQDIKYFYGDGNGRSTKEYHCILA